MTFSLEKLKSRLSFEAPEPWTEKDRLELQLLLGNPSLFKAIQIINANFENMAKNFIRIKFSSPEATLEAAALQGKISGGIQAVDELLDLTKDDPHDD